MIKELPNYTIYIYNMTREDWDVIKKVMLGMDKAADSSVLEYAEIVKKSRFEDEHIDALFCTEHETPMDPWAYWTEGKVYVEENVLEDWWIYPEGMEYGWDEYEPTYELEKGYFTQQEWQRFLWLSNRFNDMINLGEDTI